jgi:AcrR family transcriptional regulator
MPRRLPDSIWLRPAPKGRQPGFSRRQIAEAALAIADTEGFEQVSMRRVAARLHAGTMTLYHYVRTKDDLVALMDDVLMEQVLVPSTEFSHGWREAISAIARRTRVVFRRHLWALVSLRSAPPGPHAMEHFEQCLTALADAPLAPADKLALLGCVDDLAFGSALRSETAERRAQIDRTTERAIRKFGEQLLATGRFPQVAALFGDLSEKQSAALFASTTEDERFEICLTAILDRFDRAAARRRPLNRGRSKLAARPPVFAPVPKKSE